MFDQSAYELPAVSEESERAREMIHSKIRLGKDAARQLLQHCMKNIPRDRYVRPMPQAQLFVQENGKPKLVYNPGAHNAQAVTLHRNAIGQIADTIGLPRNYVGKLDTGEEWREELLAYNINELFKNQEFRNRLKQPAEFLHRLVGNELRAFLTQSYNRHLLSMPLLAAFKEACDQVGAQAVQAQASDTKVGLQCYLPYAFEPVRGEFIAIGVWWGNSDFGDGKLKVSHTIMRCRGWGSAIMEDSYSRVHLGGVVRDSDLRLSDEVAAKEIDTVAAAIKDAVNQVLHPDAVRKLCEVIGQASAEEIPWEKLKGQLGKLLSREQVDKIQGFLDTPITDLPPPGMDRTGKPLATRWWAAAAIALLGEHETDPDRQSDLKQISGKFLGEAA